MTRDLGVTGYCLHGRHHNCTAGPPGYHLTDHGIYICPCACHTTPNPTPTLFDTAESDAP
jgi:hypothetical protein